MISKIDTRQISRRSKAKKILDQDRNLTASSRDKANSTVDALLLRDKVIYKTENQ
jgi:hypothetical protein